jgi:hypothetical protein
LKPSQVIIADSKSRNLDPTKVLNATNHAVKSGGILLHNGKTSLLLEKIGSGEFAAHLFTQDPPVILARTLMTFFRNIEKRGVHILYGKADNGSIINMLRRLGQQINVPIKESDRAGYNWMIKL